MFEDPVFGSEKTSYQEYCTQGIFIAILYFLPLLSTSLKYIMDRKAGTLDRILVAGITSTEIIIASITEQIFTLLFQAVISFALMTYLFDITIKGSVVAALGLAVLIGISGVAMGFLVAALVMEEVQAVALAMGTFFPNFALAGVVWPVEAMPKIMQWIGLLLPCNLASESMRSIVTRGLPILHDNVWPGFVTTLLWLAFYSILAVVINRHSAKHR